MFVEFTVVGVNGLGSVHTTFAYSEAELQERIEKLKNFGFKIELVEKNSVMLTEDDKLVVV